MATSKVLEDLDLSNDEVKRLGEALKDETFRKMLVEYAEEISNPENRRKAEEEIAIMENERGMSVQFIHPEAGYVLKTTVDGSKKAFINICQNDKIEKPKAKKQTGPDGKRGVMWQIPHSFAPPRDDCDKSHQVCSVFDVVFHPDTYRMAMSNERFKKLVEDTAVDGIESQFGVKLDKTNIRHPKLKFKGIPQATVIRERLDEKAAKASPDTSDPDDILSQMPYPYDNKTSTEKTNENQLKHAKMTAHKSDDSANSASSKFTVPKYTITHRSEVDMSEYRNAPDAKTSTCPKELVIKIQLPLLNSAAQVSLDIFEKKLILESVSPAAYKLDLSLPYQVNEDEGSAKFDKSKRTLTVTLPVVPPKTPPLPFCGSNEDYISETSISFIEDLSPNVTVDSTLDNKPECLVQDNQVKSNETGLESMTQENGDTECDKKLTFPNRVHWVLPNYQFSQDNETISLVINVKNVEERTVDMFFPQSFAAVVQFMSMGAGCFPVYYRLYMQFPEACKILEHCNFDVSDSNLVFVILKDRTCRGLWDSFSIGIDEHQLEEKQFLTESNLQRALVDLDKEALEAADMPGQVEMTPDLSVVEMTEKRLRIDIKPPKGRKWKVPEMTEEEEDDYDPPSSAEIEVVHKNPLPDLHSILKQRTLSESSEEVSTPDPDSPRSEGEELSSSFNKKRSVSFNNHVDRASFKSCASVSSMTPGLKSKRRRQRKREEKKKGRVRCNSEGTSSSEECLHSVSDSYSMSEEEGDVAHKKSKGGKKPCLFRVASDPGPDVGGLTTVTEREKGCGDPRVQTRKKNKSFDFDNLVLKSEVLGFRTNGLANGESEDGVRNVNDSEENNPHEMNVDANVDLQVNASKRIGEDKKSNGSLSSEEKNILDKNKKIISEIKGKLSEANCAGKNEHKDDSDDDDFVDAVSSLAEEFKTKLDCKESVSNGSSQLLNGTGSEELESLNTPPINENSCLIEEIESAIEYKPVTGKSCKPHSKERGGKERGDKDREGCSIQHEQPGVETVLSWKEGPISSEHVTTCAVQFSNSLMFDLDI